MIGAADVDALLATLQPRPAFRPGAAVLVTGPWLAGVSGVIAALRDGLPQHPYVEVSDLAPDQAPLAVVFVVSAAAPLTESDCALLDAVAGRTDVVIAVVSKIDVHRVWREVLTANRDLLTAHAFRYAAVPWLGVAAAPQVGAPRLDGLVTTLRQRLADPAVARRNTLRAWESQLQVAARQCDHDAEGAGRRARLDALRTQRSAALRQRRQAQSQRTIALRDQIQQARMQLFYRARSRCLSLRTELQETIVGLSRPELAGFESHTRDRAQETVAEVAQSTATCLADLAARLGVPTGLPQPERLPTIDVGAPRLQARRLESRLMMLLSAGFGLGVALTLSRLFAQVAAGLTVGLVITGVTGCRGRRASGHGVGDPGSRPAPGSGAARPLDSRGGDIVAIGAGAVDGHPGAGHGVVAAHRLGRSC